MIMKKKSRFSRNVYAKATEYDVTNISLRHTTTEKYDNNGNDDDDDDVDDDDDGDDDDDDNTSYRYILSIT